jgi:hypothetical protein
MHHPLSISWQGDLTTQQLLILKTPIFTQICGVHESPNSDTQGRKAVPFLSLPTQMSKPLNHH